MSVSRHIPDRCVTFKYVAGSPDQHNPRIDRVVRRPPGRVRRLLRLRPRVFVLRGVPTPGAELRNLLGAPLPRSGDEILCNVIVPPRSSAGSNTISLC